MPWKGGYPVIDRYGFYVTKWRLTKDGRCPRCGAKIDIVGEFRGKGVGPMPLM